MIYAVVRFAQEGFHQWPDAKGKREYLAFLHRHLFQVEVKIEVRHEDREIEFHDLLDDCRSEFKKIVSRNDASLSCEMMAKALAGSLANEYKYLSRDLIVGVFEDGECGAEITIKKEGANV